MKIPNERQDGEKHRRPVGVLDEVSIANVARRVSSREAATNQCAEVNLLCGAKYKPSESEFKRAGSEQGSVYLDGDKEVIKRPRVRDANGEVSLEVYIAASSQRNLFIEVVGYMEQGLSQRGAERGKSK